MLAPTLMPTTPPDCARAASRAQRRVGALRIKAQPVDDGLIGIKSEHARPRIAGLRPWRDGADFDETEAQSQQRVRHLGIFVEPGGDADRVRKIQPEYPHCQPFIVVRRRRERREFQHPDRQTMGVFRLERVQKRPCQAVEQSDHGFSSGKVRLPSTLVRQEPRPTHGVEGKLPVKMRKQFAAARRLPFECRPESVVIDRHQHQIGLPGKVFRRRGGKLCGGREMNEPVAPVGIRSTIDPGPLGIAPSAAFADLINCRHAMGLRDCTCDPNGP